MDIRKIKKLIELLEESGIAELEIKEGEESVRISRQPTGYAQPMRRACPHGGATPAARPRQQRAQQLPEPNPATRSNHQWSEPFTTRPRRLLRPSSPRDSRSMQAIRCALSKR